MTIGILPPVARDVAEIDIPESFLLANFPCSLKIPDGGRCEIAEFEVGIKPCYMPWGFGSEGIPYS
jgi:hypothetical protein